MKAQIINRNDDVIRFRRNKNAHIWRSLAIGAVLLLAVTNHAGAQSLASSQSEAANLVYGPTTCWVNPTGGNGCMSPQYRSGASGNTPGSAYNSNLTGSPVGDKNILNPSTVNSTNMVLLTSINAPGLGGCQLTSFGPLPTASPSIESRIVFPALDTEGVCSLFTYDVTFPSDAQYVARIGTGLTFVTSSPGYNGKVVIGAEDGHVYAYDWASDHLAWTFTNPWGWGFDASPTTWPGLNYVYIVDPAGHVFYLDPADGTAKNIVQTGIEPGGGAGVPGAISASSLSVSVAHNLVFVAGESNSDPYGDEVCALNATTAGGGWCQTFTDPPNPVAEDSFIASSPVVSDSEALVYVTDQGQGNQPYSGTANLFALNVNSGNVDWEVSLVPTPTNPWDSYSPLM